MFVCVYTHVYVCMYVWQCGPTIVWRLALFQFTLVAFSDNETYLHLLLIIRLMTGAVVIGIQPAFVVKFKSVILFAYVCMSKCVGTQPINTF